MSQPARPADADNNPVIVEHEDYIKALVAAIKALKTRKQQLEQQITKFNEYMATERAKLAQERKDVERARMGDPTRPRVPRSKAIHNPLD